MQTCKTCDKELTHRDQKKFCSLSCSATYNNIGKRKYTKVWCRWCASSFYPRSKTNVFCNKRCRDHQLRSDSEFRLEQGELTAPCSVRAAILRIRDYKCEECGISEWLNKPITLEIDHKDGNPDNNHPNNLSLLCPNCHSQTPTFRTKNLNGPKSDRRSKARRKMYYNGSGPENRTPS